MTEREEDGMTNSDARARAIELIEGELIESDDVRGSIHGAAGHALDALVAHPEVLRALTGVASTDVEGPRVADLVRKVNTLDAQLYQTRGLLDTTQGSLRACCEENDQLRTALAAHTNP